MAERATGGSAELVFEEEKGRVCARMSYYVLIEHASQSRQIRNFDS